MDLSGNDIDDDPSFELDSRLEDEEVKNVLTSGTDLRAYAKDIEKQLKKEENRSIQDYIKESQNIVSLHNQIADCDSILERMEMMLIGFQADLGSISSEIVSLQKKSIVMNQQLHNRQAVRAQLSQYVEDMVVPDSLITGILDVPASDKEFLVHLNHLNDKMNFFKEQSSKELRSCDDVRKVLEMLKIEAVTKIRAYLMEQISKLRKAHTNYQVPQNTLLKHKFFFEFALNNERAVAQEVCNDYVNTMGRIYYSYFKSYSTLLSKLVYENAATKDDLMGIEETRSRGLFHKPTTFKQKTTVFSIGTRADVLDSQLEAPIIIPHSAQKAEQKFPYEALFRSEQYALVDNASREYLFINEFFMVKKNKPALDVFSQIMGRTVKLLSKNLENYVNTSYDTISLFLCIQLINRYKILCHKRANAALDDYWEELLSILWPRFEYVFHMNIQSIKDCDCLKFGAEMRPHYIARRYAEFSGAIVSISESFPDERVSRLLAQLLEEVKLFLLGMAGQFNLRSHQLVFLINNYDMILGVLMERTRENCKEVECIRELLQQYSTEYVEVILSQIEVFGGIMQFVKETEPFADQPDHLKKVEGKALSAAQAFTLKWKGSLEALDKEIRSSFPSLVTGSSLLQLALGHLLHLYERFNKLLTLQARSQFVNIHHIKVEIKKYKTNYS